MSEWLFDVTQIKCRICFSDRLEAIWDMGSLALTGVFYRKNEEHQTSPIVLGFCLDCGLTQLLNTYQNDFLYGERYGYESHLNSTMARHLQNKARVLEDLLVSVPSGCVAMDIASNDGTLLSGYSEKVSTLIGVDPLIDNFVNHYPKETIRYKSFFPDENWLPDWEDSIDIITSCSVLYDIENPMLFAKSIRRLLTTNGVWHTEQSYLEMMKSTLSYDTICHEHLLYLRLQDIAKICEHNDLKIIDVEFNDVNGGSAAITIARNDSIHIVAPRALRALRDEEENIHHQKTSLIQFVESSKRHQIFLKNELSKLCNEGYEIVGLGASTKGNVLLQKAQLDFISRIGEINPKKFGLLTPGTRIPIVPQEEIFSDLGADKICALILPWHFSEGIQKSARRFLDAGGKLLIPLPEYKVVQRDNFVDG